MKLRKIFAGMSALAIAATMAITASAETGDTFLMLADGQWLYQNMNNADKGRPLPTGGKTVQVTEDGEYTVDVTIQGCVDWTNSDPDLKEKVELGDPAFGITVLNVDIEGLAAKLGCSTDEDAWDDYCTNELGIKAKKATAKDKMAFARSTGFDVTALTLKADGNVVYEYAPDEIIFGDIEGNGKIRIELFNQYGDTYIQGFAPDAIKTAAGDLEYESLEVTFTVTGVNGKEEEAPAEEPAEETPAETPADTTETPADTTTTTDTTPTTTTGTGTPTTGANTNTGASAGLALAGLALAGAAVVVSKKR